MGSENKELILFMNKLYELLTSTGTLFQFDLPQIVVVGSQSVGKSSVLENIVGRDFLPRGDGIVTRCPLILQLINGEEEYGVFGHSEKKIKNFAEIRKEIEAQTNRLAGNDKGIVDKPIRLSIHSPDVLNLTLVDLPGLIRNPRADDPTDIEEQIKNMILRYISKENCLILAVSAANVDLAVSDALKLAREVDKDGHRTIGVITKLDLMGAGTNARDIFEGKSFPLRRGYVGVVNRSQDDINKNKDIASSLKHEKEYLQKHYKDMAHRLGTPYLQKFLNQQLTEHIRKTLPALQSEWQKKMALLKKDLAEFERSQPQDPELQRKLLLKLATEMNKDFQTEVGTGGSNIIDTNRLTAGAKIKRIFHESLPDEISKIQLQRGDLLHDIEYAIKNARYHVTLNSPFEVFQCVVRQLLSKLEVPINKCIDSVIDELSNAVKHCVQGIKIYWKLRDFIERETLAFIYSNEFKFKENVLSLVNMELAYINVKHSSFMKNLQGQAGNRSIREGSLQIIMKSGKSRTFWITLNPKSISCTKDIAEDVDEDQDDVEAMFLLPLNDLAVRINKSDLIIVLFRSDGQNVCLNYKELKMSCPTVDEFDCWYRSISYAIKGGKTGQDPKNLEPSQQEIDEMCRQVESYMNIVKADCEDMVIKATTLYVIKELEKFIGFELLAMIVTPSDGECLNMLTVDQKEKTLYEEKKKMYKSCEMALEAIRNSNIGSDNELL